MPATPKTHDAGAAVADQPKDERIRDLNAREAPDSPRQGRRAAGQDPVKRQQILDGAKRCFLSMGFEAASMNEITAEAGVSKGTIYVYFADKEELFAELIDRERGSMLISAQQLLDNAGSVEQALTAFGRHVTLRLTSDQVVKAQRMVLGVAERMPDLARRFFGPDPFSGVAILKSYFDGKVASGDLAIADTELAARQFIDLAQAGIFKRRLFGSLTEEEGRALVETVVGSAVGMFLRYYRPGKGR